MGGCFWCLCTILHILAHAIGDDVTLRAVSLELLQISFSSRVSGKVSLDDKIIGAPYIVCRYGLSESWGLALTLEARVG